MNFKSSNISVFQSIIYRPGTQINLGKFHDKTIYNHSKGLIPYIESGIVILEPGGIYTLESLDSELIKEAKSEIHPSAFEEVKFDSYSGDYK